jgi:small nuclear ribonucleoprotein (snRNP)-like protein
MPETQTRLKQNPEANIYESQVTGTLKGYDQLMNLVLDDVKEVIRGSWIPAFFLSFPPFPEKIKVQD